MKIKKLFGMSMLTLSMMLMFCSLTSCVDSESESNNNQNTDNSGLSGGDDGTQTELLNQAKNKAKADLDTYASTKLTQAGKIDNGTVAALLVDLKTDIDAAITVDAVNTVFANAKKEIDNAIANIVVDVEENNEVLTYVQGLNETIALEWNASNYPESSTNLYYKLSTDSSYTKVDDELTRANGSIVRADILGLKPGKYTIKLENGSSRVVKNDIEVIAQDRSGYAHFNTTKGVGGYNNDGTIKDDAVIIYVNDENKNTVKAIIGGKEYTGLSNIMAAQNEKVTTPLIVRIVGMIATPTWNPKTLAETDSLLAAVGKSTIYEDDIISRGINTLNYQHETYGTLTKLEGLDNRIKYVAGNSDSVYNTMNIKNASNVTVEGVGTDAMFFQWGMTWKNCSYIEVRNITFDDYTEDACSFEGSETSCTTISGFKTGHIWIHNNTFNEGINYWDVTAEQDKHEGDGATDFKGNAYLTIAYNHYNKNHKTGLVGGGDTQTTACITYHHNYYQSNSSRLPLGRRANMHMYNNYYYGTTSTNMSLRNGAYAFIEGCYFENTSNPCEIKSGGATSAAKSYNNIVNNCKGVNNMTVVSSRTETVENGNIYGNTFDTNSSIFYYDSTNKVSNVSVLTDADTAKKTCVAYSGVLKKNATAYPMSNDSQIVTPPPVVEEPGDTDDTNWNTLYSNDFNNAQEFGTEEIKNQLYYQKTLASDKVCSNGINQLSIKDEKLYIEDTDTGCVTNAYLKFDDITSGKVKISLDVLYEGDFPAKWTAIQLLSITNNEFLGIRSADTSNNIGYRVDGGNVTNSTLVSASTEFNVTIVLDIDQKSAKVTINNQTFTVDLTSSSKLNGFSGIKLFTATGERSFYIDNLLIQTA